jgi:hypothetical protein
MARRKSVGSDPLSEEERIMRDFYRPSESKPGKPDTQRQTYHVEVDLIEKVKRYAYIERLKISEVVNRALKEFFQDKEFTQ